MELNLCHSTKCENVFNHVDNYQYFPVCAVDRGI